MGHLKSRGFYTPAQIDMAVSRIELYASTNRQRLGFFDNVIPCGTARKHLNDKFYYDMESIYCVLYAALVGLSELQSIIMVIKYPQVACKSILLLVRDSLIVLHSLIVDTQFTIKFQQKKQRENLIEYLGRHFFLSIHSTFGYDVRKREI